MWDSMSDKQREEQRCETCRHFETFPDYYDDPQEDHEAGGMCKCQWPHSPVDRSGYCVNWEQGQP